MGCKLSAQAPAVRAGAKDGCPLGSLASCFPAPFCDRPKASSLLLRRGRVRKAHACSRGTPTMGKLGLRRRGLRGLALRAGSPLSVKTLWSERKRARFDLRQKIWPRFFFPEPQMKLKTMMNRTCYAPMPQAAFPSSSLSLSLVFCLSVPGPFWSFVPVAWGLPLGSPGL